MHAPLTPKTCGPTSRVFAEVRHKPLFELLLSHVRQLFHIVLFGSLCAQILFVRLRLLWASHALRPSLPLALVRLLISCVGLATGTDQSLACCFWLVLPPYLVLLPPYSVFEPPWFVYFGSVSRRVLTSPSLCDASLSLVEEGKAWATVPRARDVEAVRGGNADAPDTRAQEGFQVGQVKSKTMGKDSSRFELDSVMLVQRSFRTVSNSQAYSLHFVCS